ncbi:unnamed protein product [Schistocephalus solidus]|uniref:Anoctamin n=1 Tax=Schistocephalus solidus TaxID=70667 RepID=A0A183TIF6_SCHSO|nr:unnamed protein product [Schistocephalus solidus]
MKRRTALATMSRESSLFYMTVCACTSSDVRHRSRHNQLVAQKLASLLSSVGKLSDHSKLIVTPCCPSGTTHTDHTKHFIALEAPKHLLRHYMGIVNHYFSDLFTEGESSDPSLNPDILSPGQRSWLGSLAVRMLHLSEDQLSELRTLKSCKTYESNEDVHENQNKRAATPHKSLITGEDTALFCLRSEGLTKELTPLHDVSARAEVLRHFSAWHSQFPAVEWLHWYFGDGLGYYFAWLRYYCLALLLLTGLGLTAWLSSTIAYLFSAVKDEEYLAPSEGAGPHISTSSILYGLITVVWAIAFTKICRRQQSQLAEVWISPALTGAADLPWIHNSYDSRPQFRGTPRVSPITGQWELYFPPSERRIRYLISGSVTFLCVLFAIFINVLLMNLEGFVKADRSPYLYFYFISCWTEPGCIFDPVGGSLNFIPSILHPLLVNIMNQVVFRQIAEYLTETENHKTQASWDHSLIVKRFLFEAIDAYACPAYLGFILVDWAALRSMLVTTFATDSVRRLVAECLVPWISFRFRSYKDSKVAARRKKSEVEKMADAGDQEAVSASPLSPALHAAQFGVSYEPFDDYLEMVLEHGYLVLFAVAVPPYLATMACLCAWVEAYFDSFKLLQIFRRPLPELLQRGQDIWLLLLSIQAWLGLFANVALLACGTDWSLSNLVSLEHALIGIGLFIELFFSNIPKKAKESYQARAYHEFRRVTASLRLSSPPTDGSLSNSAS